MLRGEIPWARLEIEVIDRLYMTFNEMIVQRAEGITTVRVLIRSTEKNLLGMIINLEWSDNDLNGYVMESFLDTEDHYRRLALRY